MARPTVLAELVEFCDVFFPAPDNSTSLGQRIQRLASKKNPFANLSKTDKFGEATVRARFAKAVHNNNLAPGLKFCECGEVPDPSALDGEEQTVGMAFYRAEHATSVGEQRWPDQLIPVEFIPSNAADRLGDELNAKKGVRVDTLTSKLLYAVQHRAALFTLFIIGTTAFFVRLDRAGAIMTRPCSYFENWEMFCDIFWRISLCTDAQLGLDPTAVRLRPGDPDFDRMAAAAEPHASDVDEKERDLVPGELPADGRFVYKYVRTMFSESVHSNWPQYRVEVPNADGTRHFLIAKPTFCTKSVVGRGTRGYVALDCETGNFVWLKDVWRAHHLVVDKEGEVLRRLNEAEVRHVPTLICHGDIEDQVTLTSGWWEAENTPPPSTSKAEPDSQCSSPSSAPGLASSPSASHSLKRKRDDERSEDCVPPPNGLSTLVEFKWDCPFRVHRHYRLVEREVGMPLESFENGQQLVSVVLDCIYAHFDAATKPEVPMLHRDISGANILIIPCVLEDDLGAKIKWTGFLTDWEMSKPMDGSMTAPGERIGTWQFQSVALLCRPKDVEICDELESFFYVILYYAVRYLRSNVEAVGNWIYAFFDACGFEDGNYICGHKKLCATKDATVSAATPTYLFDDTPLWFDSPLDVLVFKLLRWFKANFVCSQYKLRQERLQKAVPEPQQAASDPPRRRRRGPRLAGLPKVVVVRLAQRSLPRDGRPSAKEEKRSGYLKTHVKMVEFLRAVLASNRWRGDDKVGDRIDEECRPRVQASGSGPTMLACDKRRRIESAATI